MNNEDKYDKALGHMFKYNMPNRFASAPMTKTREYHDHEQMFNDKFDGNYREIYRARANPRSPFTGRMLSQQFMDWRDKY